MESVAKGVRLPSGKLVRFRSKTMFGNGVRNPFGPIDEDPHGRAQKYVEARVKGKTVGDLAVSLRPRNKGEIMNTYVKPELQRKGIATGMLVHANKVSGVKVRHSKTLTDEGAKWAAAVSKSQKTRQANVVSVLSGTGAAGLAGIAASETLGKDPIGHTKYTYTGKPLSPAARTRVLRINAKHHGKDALLLTALGAGSYGAGRLVKMKGQKVSKGLPSALRAEAKGFNTSSITHKYAMLGSRGRVPTNTPRAYKDMRIAAHKWGRASAAGQMFSNSPSLNPSWTTGQLGRGTKQGVKQVQGEIAVKNKGKLRKLP